MTPEVQLLLINAAGLGFAYGVVYPRLLPITWAKIVVADVILTASLLAAAAYLFWGTGTQFWLFGWYVGAVPFALITLMALELPLFSWFAKKHGIDL
jgi:hypothetical protein